MAEKTQAKTPVAEGFEWKSKKESEGLSIQALGYMALNMGDSKKLPEVLDSIEKTGRVPRDFTIAVDKVKDGKSVDTDSSGNIDFGELSRHLNKLAGADGKVTADETVALLTPPKTPIAQGAPKQKTK